MRKEILIKKPTHQVMVGSVPVGGGAPVVVQSMTNTDTADIEKTLVVGVHGPKEVYCFLIDNTVV